MKALILAAGFGTRLLPFTQNRPKPLFTIANRPLLDIIIHDLQNAGCKEIIINTHHLHQKIESFIGNQEYTLPVRIRHEAQILGTGGAIKNTEDFWNGSPFIVINSDIFTDINIKAVYEFHLRHNHPATLVLHDYPEFNNVSISEDGFITGFHNKAKAPESKLLAFTGIQVLDPKIVDFIPAGVFFSSIDLYRNLILAGLKVRSFISKNHFWRDIGTPQTYQETVFEKMANDAFRRAWPGFSGNKIIRKRLKGDGSDRKWYRLTSDDRSLVMVDHGIKIESTTSEADSFVAIGRHLHNKGIPVPKIHIYDTFSGQVFLEDLGDENLQSFVLKAGSLEDIVFCYQSVINSLVHLSISGARQFNPSWTYQTPYYNKDLILSKECRYFVDAFLKGYLGMDSFFEDFENEFSSIADKALEFTINGFMHRDLQSRNIMVKNNRFYFIDFQGGRLGPIQYDLASLLLDPYVDLPRPVQNQLLDYAMEKLSTCVQIDLKKFCICYNYCSITRNLQILGAFGYLTRIKGKRYFEKYIPKALKTLKNHFNELDDRHFPKLKSIMKKL